MRKIYYLCLLLAMTLRVDAQTVKSLAYNVSNGVVVYTNTNALTFTSPLSFGTNPAVTRSNLGALATNGSAAGLTNFPANLARTNGDASALTNFPSFLLRTNGDGGGLSNVATTIFKVLTNNFSITNQTNMTEVTNLTVTIEPNKRYAFQFYPIVSANADPSTSMRVIASNATVYGTWNGVGSGFGSTNRITNELTFSAVTTRAIVQFFQVIGGTNTNPGTISVQLRSTNATNINTLESGTFIRADKMPQ